MFEQILDSNEYFIYFFLTIRDHDPGLFEQLGIELENKTFFDVRFKNGKNINKNKINLFLEAFSKVKSYRSRIYE